MIVEKRRRREQLLESCLEPRLLGSTLIHFAWHRVILLHAFLPFWLSLEPPSTRPRLIMPTNIDDLELDEPPTVEPYEVLAVEKTATQDQIKTAYRKAALKWHPGESTLPSLCPSSLTPPRQGQTRKQRCRPHEVSRDCSCLRRPE